MSKANVNQLTKTYSGIFGNQVVLRNRKGKSVMVMPSPGPKVEPNANQINVRKKFTAASKFAKNILKYPVMMEAQGTNWVVCLYCSHDRFPESALHQ